MGRFRNGFFLLCSIFVTVIVNVLFSKLVFAAPSSNQLTESLMNEFSQNNILYYNPAECINNPANSNGSSGAGSWDGTSTDGLSDAQSEFVDKWHNIAEKLSIEYGIPWEAVLSQGIIESASGTSYYARERNNFFGLNAIDSDPDQAYSYPTPEEGWRGYYEFIRVNTLYAAKGAFSGKYITDPYAYIYDVICGNSSWYATACKDDYEIPNQYQKTNKVIIAGIENRIKEKGWKTSAELAKEHPEMLANAAKNAAMLNGGSDDNGAELNSGSTDQCVKLTTSPDFTTSGYQERISNLKNFNQIFGTFSKEAWQPGVDSSGRPYTISGYACGFMSLYAAYYMYSGQGLNDKNVFDKLLAAAKEDHYHNGSSGSNPPAFGENLKSITEMSYEAALGASPSWDELISELKQGRKIIYNVVTPSLWTGGGHLMLLDHYDESKDKIFLFDPAMDNYGSKYQRDTVCSYSDVECVGEGDDLGYNGLYIGKDTFYNSTAMTGFWSFSYDGCYTDGVGGSGYCSSDVVGSRSASDSIIGDVSESSVDVPCDPRTTDRGVKTGSYEGRRIEVRTCEVPNIPDSEAEGGKAIVNSRVSGAFYALVEAYKERYGRQLSSVSSFRSYEQQAYYYDLYIRGVGNLAAEPGTSRHESGLAIDFTNYGHSFDLDFLAEFGFKDGRNFSQVEYWHVEPK